MQQEDMKSDITNWRYILSIMIYPLVRPPQDLCVYK